MESVSFPNLITLLVLQGCCWDHIYTLSWIDFPKDHSKIVAFLAWPSADYFFGRIKVKMDIQPKLISNKLSPLPASGLVNWCSCQTLFYKHRKNKKQQATHPSDRWFQGILKGEVSLYCWPPVWLVWNQLYDYWQFLFLFEKQANPNQSNRRSMVQWYFPL